MVPVAFIYKVKHVEFCLKTKSPQEKMSTTGPESSAEASEFEGTFTVTQILPVTAEEELKPDNAAAEGVVDEHAAIEDVREQQQTYQLEPVVAVKPTKLTYVAKRTLEKHLRDVKGYDADEMREAALKMSSAIRDRVKRMGLDRYRIVCQVTVGEKCDQDVAATFLCLWRHEFDHYATATYDGEGFFATAVVFVVYKQ